MKAILKLTIVGLALLGGLAGCSPQKDVPALEGMDLKSAQARIVELGFQVGRIDNEFTGQKDSGKVLRQVPSSSAPAPKGAKIDLTVEESVTMPDLNGMEVDEAKSALAALGLPVQSIKKEFVGGQTSGLITTQRPAAGARIAPRSAVNFTVDEFVVVPDLVDEVYDKDVQARVQQTGLQVGKKTNRQSTNSPGTVLEQKPEALTKVPKGTLIRLVLAEAPPPEVRPGPGTVASTNTTGTAATAGTPTNTTGTQTTPKGTEEKTPSLEEAKKALIEEGVKKAREALGLGQKDKGETPKSPEGTNSSGSNAPTDKSNGKGFKIPKLLHGIKLPGGK